MSAFRYRPIPQSDPIRPRDALTLAGGPLWFSTVAVHARGADPRVVPAEQAPADVLERLSLGRAPICGLSLDRPRIMGVLNVTPDSFSDGGRYLGLGDALARAKALLRAGADILDIGGESTRPGAEPVSTADEMARVLPVIRALRSDGLTAPISIDTRNAAVAEAAFAAGADFFNDVSALSHDTRSLGVASGYGAPVCLMHAQGDPRTMQHAPAYDDVLLDVYDYLEARVAVAEAAGIPRARLLIDPGLGFGKNLGHNLALIRGLGMLHGIGCAVLLGASRKRFIGTIGGGEAASDRMPGSVAVALEGLRQGAQVLRVHDVAETAQAAALWSALADASGR